MTEQIKRYDLSHGALSADDSGRFVLHSDHLAARVADKAEIERLESERAELWRKCRDRDGSVITKSAVIAEQKALIAELEAVQDEAVRRDAERYRWLRQLRGIDTNTLPSLPWVIRVEGMLPTMTACYTEELDSAVDAAIAAAKDRA